MSTQEKFDHPITQERAAGFTKRMEQRQNELVASAIADINQIIFMEALQEGYRLALDDHGLYEKDK